MRQAGPGGDSGNPGRATPLGAHSRALSAAPGIAAPGGGRGGQFPRGSPAPGFPRSPSHGRSDDRRRPPPTPTGPCEAVPCCRSLSKRAAAARGRTRLQALGTPAGTRPSPRAPPLPPALGPPGEPGRAAWALRGRCPRRAPHPLHMRP
ncbi:Dynamin-3 [Manis pentadactyla]|nr:Dynamin-3 [Manis pentadactyla]